MTNRFGRYELLHPLGRGGMAELFLARYSGPEGFEKRLVIKRVLPELAGDRRFLALFFEEARIQVSLVHGNLVPVFDFGRVGNSYFIAMEHVAGCDLGALLAAWRGKGETLPAHLIAYLGAEVCRGLAYVHRRGYVHRDVAPRNILLSRDGEVRLSDFGVALTPASQAAPAVRGTLAYMAPEQASGRRPDGRADLFSLGMVLGEAVLGRRVRDHADPQVALEAARHPEPIAVEGPLAAIVARATAPAPGDRYPDAEAMQRALEAAGGTASAGAELAAVLRNWLGTSDDAAPPARPEVQGSTEADVGPATYFRDGTVAAVEDLMATPAPRSRARFWVGAGLVATLLAAAGASLALVRKTPAPAAIASTPTPTPAPAPDPAPTVVQVPDPTPPAREPVRATPSPATKPRPHATATVLVRCSPWCVPYLDDDKHPRGADSKQHTLTVTPGRHRVIAHRLDDRQTQVIDVAPGKNATVDFQFP